MPYVLLAYRSAEHEATGFTPARLMFGRELRLPVDLATGRPPGAELPNTYTDYAQTLQQRLEEAHRWARQHLKVSGQAMWRQYQGRARNAQHRPGDWVWLHNPQRKPGKSPKLQSDWKGPYKVAEVLSAVNYRLEMPEKKRASKIVHVDRLWRHPGEGKFTWGEKTGSEERGSDSSGSESGSDSDSNPDSDSDVNSDRDTEEGDEDAVHRYLLRQESDEEVEIDSESEETLSDTEERVNESELRPLRNRRPPAWLMDYVIDV